jgi:hypothetical protein
MEERKGREVQKDVIRMEGWQDWRTIGMVEERMRPKN